MAGVQPGDVTGPRTPRPQVMGWLNGHIAVTITSVHRYYIPIKTVSVKIKSI